MSFNPNKNKQAQCHIFIKTRKFCHPNLYFNDQSVEISLVHKHLGINLDEGPSFTYFINDQISKNLKDVGLFCKLSTLLPQQSLLTIYKFFIRHHLDYGDVIYDESINESLSNRAESLQYKTALPVSRYIQGSCREKLY